MTGRFLLSLILLLTCWVDVSVSSFFGPSTKTAKIPTSQKDRDIQAISGVKAAITSPKSPSFPLVECEFPPLERLNKLGDGSLRSALEVEKANLAFASKLTKSIAPVPFIGPKTWLLVSSAASNSFLSSARNAAGSSTVHSLKDGLPDVGEGDVCVFVTPSSRSDYEAAKRIASPGGAGAVVLVNGFAKDQKSVPGSATMGYFLKPLTYNSQVVGYLARVYPGKWVTIDAITNQVLSAYVDEEILVRGTNTPDLRQSGKIVQKSVDDRAILARKNN
eukprot:CAMPEP_0113531976 /NCGR_PEP_ID=MMETSP0015_2-20120614/3793_1 /TAXON_ID=2838 /ORGANISM="Odontella" /LENGTH=275 /DNA_ID=CAMNT_0000430867 /DNA_START=100 /DNA_END=927 /DNA_ORIENTATION=+ /assembly_acc=CAM_ASM_000160